MMTVIDKLDPNISIFIEGDRAKSNNRSIYLNELLDSNDLEIVEPDEQLGSSGMNDS